MRDRFLEFINSNLELKKKLDHTYYGVDLDDSDISKSSFVKDLVLNEFKQDILRLLDVWSLEESRDSGESIEAIARSAWFKARNVTRSGLFELTDDKTLFDVSDIVTFSPKVAYFKDDGFYSLDISSTLKRFPNVKFVYTFYCYDYNLDVDSELRLIFIGDDGIPEDECRFESDLSYQRILYDIYYAFDKLFEYKYRYGYES